MLAAWLKETQLHQTQAANWTKHIAKRRSFRVCADVVLNGARHLAIGVEREFSLYLVVVVVVVATLDGKQIVAKTVIPQWTDWHIIIDNIVVVIATRDYSDRAA